MTKDTRHRRLAPDVRKRQILDGAIELARVKGYANVTAKAVAERIGISDASIFHHFPTMKQLRRAVMRAAITREELVVLGQGLAAGDEYAKRAPAGLQNAAWDALRGDQPWVDE